MKEAAGEANMTVITIILIGVIAAIAIPLVNNAMNSTRMKSCCNNAGGELQGKECVPSGNSTSSSNVEAEFQACMEETK